MIARLLHSFFGGVHLPENKNCSTTAPIARKNDFFADPLILPLKQGTGSAGVPCVQVGQLVLKYQPLTRVTDHFSTPIHAPTSGQIIAIGPHIVPHPSGLPQECLFLKPDQKDTPYAYPRLDFERADAQTIGTYLQQAGIVGLGGAVFSTHIKARPKHEHNTVILNGAECEPWITCDDQLMQAQADAILQGGIYLAHLLRADKILVGIEKNKQEAIQALSTAAAQQKTPLSIEIVPIPTLYPSGSAKQLIRILTGIEVPTGQRATDFHVQCFNVGTAFAVYDAIAHAHPLISRIVTVTGNVNTPCNLEIPLGTPIEKLLDFAGHAKSDTDRVIMGGPMMGMLLPNLTAPVVKATNCILAMSPTLFPPAAPAMPCIRCGHCAQACPMELQPMDLYWYAKAKQFDKVEQFHLFDCIECGCCRYVCPSQIPLVDYYRFAKDEIKSQKQNQTLADAARTRHEARQDRLAREKQERAERLAKKSLNPTLAVSSSEEKIPDTPPPTSEMAISTESEDPKKAAIAAAVARAQAKKAEQMQTAPPAHSQEEDSKKAAIAAAVARAQAKKAARLQQKDTPPEK